MDLDLKISAVFSLVGNTSAQQGQSSAITLTECDKKDFHNKADFSTDTVKTRDDDHKADICNTSDTLSASEDENKTATDHESSTDEKRTGHMSESQSVMDHPDKPPSLTLEKTSFQPLSSRQKDNPVKQCMSPPILQPEEPLETDHHVPDQLKEKKSRCSKIDPCYIVLTSIYPVIKDRTCISCRAFKRSFSECSNMCKKIMFRRKLYAGRDVFNVKTPTKQKDYIIYLENAEKASKRSKKKSERIKITDILAKHDSKIRKRKAAIQRIRRTVSRMPNDFANRPETPIIVQDGVKNSKQDRSKEQLAKVHKELVKQHHKVELESLKKMIAIKRSLNMRLKKNKGKIEAHETFLKSQVKSNVSGRVRKVNPIFGEDYSYSWKDIEDVWLVDAANAKLRRAETENKRKVENILMKGDTRNGSNASRKRHEDSEESGQEAKKAKVVVLDNVKEDDENFATVEEQTNNKSIIEETDAHIVAVRNMLRGNVKKKTHKQNDLNTAKKGTHNLNTTNKDGVIIQNLPNAESIMSSIFRNYAVENMNSTTVARNAQMKEGNANLSNILLQTNQVLMSQLGQKQPPQANVVFTPYMPSSTDTVSLQKLPCTESNQHVRNSEQGGHLLSVNDIKKEPVDEIEIKEEPIDTYSDSTTSDECILESERTLFKGSTGMQTVQHTSPTFTGSKKPLLALNPLISQVKKSSVPILVRTPQGLKYLVPHQLLQKGACLSSTLQTSTTPSSTTATNIAFVDSVSSPTSLIQKPQVVHVPMHTLQINQQRLRTQQPNTLGVIPSVVQTSVQSSEITQMNQTSPKANLQPKVLQLIPQSVNISTVQTLTRVQKVLPANQHQTEKKSNTVRNLLNSTSFIALPTQSSHPNVTLNHKNGSGSLITSSKTNIPSNPSKTKMDPLRNESSSTCTTILPKSDTQSQGLTTVYLTNQVSLESSTGNMHHCTLSPTTMPLSLNTMALNAPPKPPMSVSGSDIQSKSPNTSQFYLLKMDGKNVLIPMNVGQTHLPKAYIVNDQVGEMISQRQSTYTPAPVISSNSTTESQTHTTKSTNLARNVKSVVGSLQKPAMLVSPVMKESKSTNTKPISVIRNGMQTITLTRNNISSEANRINTSADVTEGSPPYIHTPYSSTSAISSGNTSSKPSFSIPYSSANKQYSNCAIRYPVVVSHVPYTLGSDKISTSLIGFSTDTYISTAQPSTYLTTLQHKLGVVQRTVPTTDPPKYPGNDRVFSMPTILHDNKPTTYGQGSHEHKTDWIKSVISEPLSEDPISTQHSVLPATVNDNEENLWNNNSEKLSDNKHDVESKESEKPKAFSEAVTSREERLRRLKELLKEKQKAVEEIRSCKK